MSESQTAAEGAGAQPNPGGDADTETRARQMGWKPLEEFRGRRDQWLPADQFMERGFESPAVMSERLKVMTDRMAGMERGNRDLTTKFDEAISTIKTMTDMARSSERRAYERARADLEREREKAVEAGDTQTFRRLDTEIRDLDKGAPVEPQRQTTTATPPVQPGPNGQQPDPAVLEFYRRNPWYGRDQAMTAEADLVHTGLMNTRRDLTMEQNLAEVERRVRAQFPGTTQQTTQRTEQETENTRRNEPSAVSPASTGANRQRDRGRRNFSNMPEESKQAFRRYKAMMTGKGEPLTEDEWAADYWSQFEEEG